MIKLPKGWKVIEEVNDQLDIEGNTVFRTGIFAQKGNNIAIGAASGLSSQGERANYELLERAYTQELFNQEKCQSDEFIESISNGVAIHSSIDSAKESAMFELVERDRVLRSWFGAGKIINVEPPKGLEYLENAYEVRAFEFLNSDDPSGIVVGGLFLFPKSSAYHLVYGLGAGINLQAALLKSYNETLTRMSFLWEEELPPETLSFSPSPHFHQDFYLRPENYKIIEDWLNGKTLYHILHGEISDDIHFDVEVIGDLFLVKASSPSRVKLYFGKKSEEEKKLGLVHPIM